MNAVEKTRNLFLVNYLSPSLVADVQGEFEVAVLETGGKFTDEIHQESSHRLKNINIIFIRFFAETVDSVENKFPHYGVVSGHFELAHEHDLDNLFPVLFLF